MPKSADQMAKAYQDAMSSGKASQNYIAGIDAYQGNPMALAASDQATQLYLQNVQASVNSGRRQQALMAANPATWKQNAKTIGANRLATGAQKAMAKVAAHFQKFAPIYSQMHDVVQSMPKGGAANAKARFGAALDVLMRGAGKA